MQRIAPRQLLPMVFLASGASSLIYEVIWTRQLSLVFGSTLTAVSIVLSVFMGGLALGSLLFGRWVDRRSDLLRVYAAMELLIAVTAGSVSWFLPQLGASAIGSLPWLHVPWVQFVVVVGLLLPPTLLMGGTLPVLVRFLTSRASRVGVTVGRLYAWNTSGAVIGCLSTDFLLVPSFGVMQTALLAATVNLLLSAAIVALRSITPDAADVETSKVEPAEFSASALQALALMSGVLALAYEVAWTRVLLFFNGSDIYVFSIMLGMLLLGIAAGSALAAPWLDRLARPGWVLARLQALIGAAALLPLIGVRVFPMLYDALFRAVPHTWGWDTVYRFMVSLAIVFVPSLMMGAAYPLLNRIYARSMTGLGADIGRLYFWNTIGGIVGSSLAGFVLVPFVGVQRTLVVLALCNMMVAALLALHERRSVFAVLVLALPLACFLLPGDYLASQTYGRRFQGIVETTEDYYGSLAIMETTDAVSGEKFRALLVNGFAMTATNYRAQRYMRLLAHLPLLLHRDPKDALVICFGTGQTLSAVATHPSVQHIDCAELSHRVLELAHYFTPWNHDVIHNPKINFLVKDGRTQVLQSHERYDVITAEPPPPHNAGVVNLYSKQYYMLCREALKPGGYVAQWLPVYELSPEDTRALVRAFVDVFPDATMWSIYKDDLCLVGSKDAPPPSYERMQALLASGPVHDDLAPVGIGSAPELLAWYLKGGESLRAWVARDAPVTDDHPSLEYTFASGEEEIPVLFFSRDPLSTLLRGAVPAAAEAASGRADTLYKLMYVRVGQDVDARLGWMRQAQALLAQSPDPMYAANLLSFTPSALASLTELHSPQERVSAAEVAYVIGKPAEGLKLLDGIDDAYAFCLAGLCKQASGDAAGAKADFERARQREPGSKEIARLLGGG